MGIQFNWDMGCYILCETMLNVIDLTDRPRLVGCAAVAGPTEPGSTLGQYITML